MNKDTVYRDDVIEKIYQALRTPLPDYLKDPFHDSMGVAMTMANEIPPAQPEQRWIPFTTRPQTDEEKEEYPEWDSILDCELPDDGQRILVSVSVRGHERVQYDEFYMDDGSYLDSGYEIGTEAVAWMPLPEPYNPDDFSQHRNPPED